MPATSASPSTAPAVPASVLIQVLRELLIGLTVCVSFAAFLTVLFHKPFQVNLVYSLCIGLTIQGLIEAGRYGFSAWQRSHLTPQRRAAQDDGRHWPGWPVMVPWVLVSVALGYAAGTFVAAMLLGHDHLPTALTPGYLRSLAVVLPIAILVSLGTTYFFYARERMALIEAQAQSARRAAAETQLRLLQSQLEPHMLFNTLANLRVLIGMDPPRAQDMLDRLIAFLRATLSASRADRHTLAAEFDRLADYLALMGVRMGPRLASRLDLPEALRLGSVPPLLLQPLVENSIKHGLEPRIEGGTIDVAARRLGDDLVLTVRDTGIGLRQDSAPVEAGFGLVQVRERLATLYGARARLDIGAPDDGRGGTLATLRLPAAEVFAAAPFPTAASPAERARPDMTSPVRALIAEDEPLLAAALRADLAEIWPQLDVQALVGDGASAVERAMDLKPQVCFLDIRLPGLSGLEAAQALAEDWPDGEPFPLIVFVTAYSQYALKAFDAQAVDYLVKPVDRQRLAACVARLRARLADRSSAAAALPQAIEQLRGLLGGAAQAASPSTRLEVIQAQVGAVVHLVPVAEVIYFEAADKYVRVITADKEHLIRLSLKELLPQLDPKVFWQIHRGTVVQVRCIGSARRDESGRVFLTLRGRPETLTASRLYAHLFKGM